MLFGARAVVTETEGQINQWPLPAGTQSSSNATVSPREDSFRHRLSPVARCRGCGSSWQVGTGASTRSVVALRCGDIFAGTDLPTNATGPIRSMGSGDEMNNTRTAGEPITNPSFPSSLPRLALFSTSAVAGCSVGPVSDVGDRTPPRERSIPPEAKALKKIVPLEAQGSGRSLGVSNRRTRIERIWWMARSGEGIQFRDRSSGPWKRRSCAGRIRLLWPEVPTAGRFIWPDHSVLAGFVSSDSLGVCPFCRITRTSAPRL